MPNIKRRKGGSTKKGLFTPTTTWGLLFLKDYLLCLQKEINLTSLHQHSLPSNQQPPPATHKTVTNTQNGETGPPAKITRWHSKTQIMTNKVSVFFVCFCMCLPQGTTVMPMTYCSACTRSCRPRRLKSLLRWPLI